MAGTIQNRREAIADRKSVLDLSPIPDAPRAAPAILRLALPPDDPQCPLPASSFPISPARRCSSRAVRPALGLRSRVPSPGKAPRVAIGCHANEAPALAIKREIEAACGEALAVNGDVADPGECDRIVAETIAGFGRLDGLVNNAGLMLGRIASFEAQDEHVRAVIDLNARSVSMTRAAVPWLERKGGFIINTTSIAARNGGGGGAVLRRGQGLRLNADPRPGQGTDRQEDPS